MLDERKASILRAVVAEYIDTATPVGSSHVARAAGVDVSSATIRNEMSVLEREGYLVQPHTSAGRIPTDKGYRFFVDQLAPRGKLDQASNNQVHQFFDNTHRQIEQLLADTSKLLSSLTASAAVVIAPQAETTTVKSAQIVPLTARRALVVAVLSNGVIEQGTIELSEELTDADAHAANGSLSAALNGQTLNDVDTTGMSPLVASAVHALTSQIDDERDVFVGGTSQMANAFEAVETVREVLATLEKQFVVVSLLRDVLGRGLSVAIGTEHGFAPLSECAVVVAPYEVDGKSVGTIGILGPTRMNYPQALAAVAAVSDRLGKRLTEG